MPKWKPASTAGIPGVQIPQILVYRACRDGGRPSECRIAQPPRVQASFAFDQRCGQQHLGTFAPLRGSGPISSFLEAHLVQLLRLGSRFHRETKEEVTPCFLFVLTCPSRWRRNKPRRQMWENWGSRPNVPTNHPLIPTLLTSGLLGEAEDEQNMQAEAIGQPLHDCHVTFLCRGDDGEKLWSLGTHSRITGRLPSLTTSNPPPGHSRHSSHVHVERALICLLCPPSLRRPRGTRWAVDSTTVSTAPVSRDNPLWWGMAPQGVFMCDVHLEPHKLLYLGQHNPLARHVV